MGAAIAAGGSEARTRVNAVADRGPRGAGHLRLARMRSVRVGPGRDRAAAALCGAGLVAVQLPAAGRLGPGSRLRPAAAAGGAVRDLGGADRGAGLRASRAPARRSTPARTDGAMISAPARPRRLLRLPAAALRHRRLRRPAGGAGPLGDRQRLDLRAVAGRSTAPPGPTSAASAARRRAGVWFLPIYLGPMLAMLLAWIVVRKMIRIAQHLPDHLDRRLHRQPLRQEPAARGARHADHRRRHRPLHRAAAEGGVRRLSAPDRRAGAVAPPALAWWQDGTLLRGAGAGRLHDHLRHPPSRQRRAARGHGRGDRLRVAGQARRLPRGRRLRDLGPVRRHGRHLGAGAGASPSCARCCASAARPAPPRSATPSGSR